MTIMELEQGVLEFDNKSIPLRGLEFTPSDVRLEEDDYGEFWPDYPRKFEFSMDVLINEYQVQCLLSWIRADWLATHSLPPARR